MNRRFLVALGARPSVVKLAPVARALTDAGAEVSICATGQHKELFHSVAGPLKFRATHTLDVMEPGQSLPELLAKAIAGIGRVIEEVRPDVVVTVGDTTSGLAAALAAFNMQVPLAHVEAGLRTYVDDDPYPEEMNRRLIDRMASYCFAPTETAETNLLCEGAPSDRVWRTGNTIVDSLMAMKTPETHPLGNYPYVLVTAHRRENIGARMDAICEAVRRLALEIPGLRFVWPLHANPAVAEPVTAALGGIHQILLMGAMDYGTFLHYLAHCEVALTDSGGVQEEAATLGKPCVVMRETTERPEGIAQGLAVLAKTGADGIVAAFRDMRERKIESGPRFRTVYGDGKAGERIAGILITGRTEIPPFQEDAE